LRQIFLSILTALSSATVIAAFAGPKIAAVILPVLLLLPEDLRRHLPENIV
jgi:hypothetical protein